MKTMFSLVLAAADALPDCAQYDGESGKITGHLLDHV
jgi:hypothetical protein